MLHFHEIAVVYCPDKKGPFLFLDVPDEACTDRAEQDLLEHVERHMRDFEKLPGVARRESDI